VLIYHEKWKSTFNSAMQDYCRQGSDGNGKETQLGEGLRGSQWAHYKKNMCPRTLLLIRRKRELDHYLTG
jgi:hypothetical protein